MFLSQKCQLILGKLILKKAADKARKNQGPTLIEAITFRMRGHEEASGTKYIDPKKFIKWEKKDPIRVFEKYLKEKKYLDSAIKKIL